MRLLVFLGVMALCLCGRASSGKTGRTLYTEEQVRQARENVAKYDWAKQSLESTTKGIEWVLKMSDEELWEFIPPAEQPRALNVRFGIDCPVHGKEIFKAGANYPWIMDREHPFKVKCPVGGEVYPSNDFDAWYKGGKKEKLDTREKYVDDGNGWVDENGNRYWFVGHYIFWQRWRKDILPVIPELAYAYILSGDTRYSHKAAVMLARIASEYPKMDYTKQAYHNGNWPARCSGKILDLDWEGSGTVVPLSTAYDQVYDALDNDAELKTFLSSKGISSAKELIEANFLQEAARCIESGIIHGNMNYQAQLALVATVLDNRDPAKGLTTEQMVDWIMNGPGEMNQLLYNGISRDGAGSEESVGYNTIWTTAFYELASKLKPLGYDLFAHPRMKKMADYYVRTAVAEKFMPRIGDASGSMVTSAAPVWYPDTYRKAYEIWGDPMYAKVLNHVGMPSPSIYEKPEALEKTKKKARKQGEDLELGTRDLGGYGLAVLESGKNENRRAVSMFYGSSGAWHGHLDRLNIEMWARGNYVLPEIGYPAHWGDKADYWARSTPSHYCVLIDENRQTAKKEGKLNLLASSPEVQVMDASGEDAYRNIASMYRRTVAMVDVSPENSYLVDVFRVRGGSRHDYSFHGPAFGELSVDGVALGPAREKGTLMGEDVEFGKTPKDKKTGGYQYLFNPRRGKPEGMWSADWRVEKSKTGLRMTMLPGSAREVIAVQCEPETKPGYPEKMEYVLARNDGGASSFVSIIEPYSGKPFIRRAQSLKTADGSTRDDLAAVRVDAGGRTDYIMSALDASKPIKLEGGITFQGEFGSIAEDGSRLRSMFLVNGVELRKDGYSVRPTESPRAKIAEVDYKANTITLDRKLPVPAAIVGQVVVISNSQHSASYTVTKVEAKADRSVLCFGDVSLVEGIGKIASVDDAAKAVQTDNRFAGYGIKYEGKLIPGRAVVNEALTQSWKISDYDNGRFVLGSTDGLTDALKNPKDGKLNVIYIAEACVGDDVMIPTSVSVLRTERDVFDVRATAPFELTLPTGEAAAAEYESKGEWQPLKVSRQNDAAVVEIGAKALAEGKGGVRVRVRGLR